MSMGVVELSKQNMSLSVRDKKTYFTTGLRKIQDFLIASLLRLSYLGCKVLFIFKFKRLKKNIVDSSLA